MKRRKFIKGLSLLSLSMFIPVIEIDIKPGQSDYQLFYNSMCSEISKAVGIPRDILTMDFAKGYSLSREMILHEWGCIVKQRAELI